MARAPIFRHRSAQLGERIPAYDASPASHARKMLADRTALAIGDPVKAQRDSAGETDG